MKVGIISIFISMFEALTQFGVLRRAFQNGIVSLSFFNPRDYSTGNYKRIDERPYGGGPGMVMMPEPLFQAVHAAKRELGENTPVYYLSPQADVLTQQKVQQMSTLEKFILVCGRYEGIDQRFIDQYVDAEISIGQYIVSGGEMPAMILIDAIARLLPGALGDPESALQESFQHGNELDYPVYTAPRLWQGHAVPAVLLEGDHQKIKNFRKTASLRKR